MIVAFALLLPVLGLSLWVYFCFRPAAVDVYRLRIFDSLVVGCAAGLCIAATVYLRNEMASGPDSAWWPVVAAIYSLVIFPVCLMVGGAVRYVICWRSTTAGSQGAS